MSGTMTDTRLALLRSLAIEIHPAQPLTPDAQALVDLGLARVLLLGNPAMEDVPQPNGSVKQRQIEVEPNDPRASPNALLRTL